VISTQYQIASFIAVSLYLTSLIVGTPDAILSPMLFFIYASAVTTLIAVACAIAIQRFDP
jgi:hypothetical protein